MASMDKERECRHAEISIIVSDYDKTRRCLRVKGDRYSDCGSPEIREYAVRTTTHHRGRIEFNCPTASTFLEEETLFSNSAWASGVNNKKCGDGVDRM